jgi:uncharacterized YccA/Bax inhibitor family protein
MSKLFESSNPLLKEGAIEKAISRSDAGRTAYSDVMTISGAVNKTFMLFGLMMITTVVSYLNPSTFNLYFGMFGGLAVYFFTYFKPTYAPISAPIYALLEGLFVGTISFMYGTQGGVDGIVSQAVMLTFGTLITMLMIYKTGLIPVTQKFRMAVGMATGAIMLAYLMSFVMSFFGAQIPYLHEGGVIGIGISVVIIGVAALNLLLDFDAFEKGEHSGAPSYMEWVCAMGLLVTLVWLYIEFLRLLSKLNRD